MSTALDNYTSDNYTRRCHNAVEEDMEAIAIAIEAEASRDPRDAITKAKTRKIRKTLNAKARPWQIISSM